MQAKAFLAGVFLLLSGCLNEPQTVSIQMEDDANEGYPLSVDLIAVGSGTLADHLMAQGQNWFSNRQFLMQNHADQMLVNHYQLMPLAKLIGDGEQPAHMGEWPTLESAETIYLMVGNFIEGTRILKVAPSSLKKVTISDNDFILAFK